MNPACPPGFLWGCATSAHQIEGSPLADGAGPSIWQRFARTPCRIAGGEPARAAVRQLLLRADLLDGDAGGRELGSTRLVRPAGIEPATWPSEGRMISTSPRSRGQPSILAPGVERPATRPRGMTDRSGAGAYNPPAFYPPGQAPHPLRMHPSPP